MVAMILIKMVALVSMVILESSAYYVETSQHPVITYSDQTILYR